MKKSNVKLFTMFIAGALFSAVAVFAATITVPTNFSSNAIQYLQKLVLTDNSGTTGIVLDGESQKINTNTICDTDGNNCKIIGDILTGGALDGYLTSNALVWTKFGNNVYYTGGFVGIGTGNPTSDLHIFGDYTELKIEGSVDATEKITFVDDGTTRAEIILNADVGDFKINNNLGPMIFSTNNTERMRISKEGDIGIGVSEPTAKLDVSGNAKFRNGIQIKSDGRYRCMNTGDIGKMVYSIVCLDDQQSLNVEPKLQLCAQSGASQHIIVDVWSGARFYDSSCH